MLSVQGLGAKDFLGRKRDVFLPELPEIARALFQSRAADPRCTAVHLGSAVTPRAWKRIKGEEGKD